MQAVLVGTTDRQLEQMLETHGMQVIAIGVGELPALAERSIQQPELLVVDVRTHAAIPPALAALKRKHPATPVLIVAARLDPALMLEAMRAGVNEWIVAPVSDDQFAAALARVLAQGPAGDSGHTIAVVGAKGGVGTTTVAASIAAALGQVTPGSTLLVDLHPWCGDAGLALGVTPRFSVRDALENGHRFDETFFRGLVVRTPSGADLLGSPERPSASAFEGAQLRSVLDFVSQLYRYTILDLPSMGGPHLDALDAAVFAVVSTQEVPALRSTKCLLDQLAGDHGRERLHVVLNRFDRRAEIELRDVEDAIGMPIQHVVPNDYQAAADALNTGRPLVLDAGRKVAAALRTVAAGVSGLQIGVEHAAERAGFLTRLKVRRYAAAVQRATT